MFDLSLEMFRVVGGRRYSRRTDGDLLQGVRFTGDGTHTQAIVMTSTTTHLENKPDVKVRFR